MMTISSALLLTGGVFGLATGLFLTVLFFYG